MKRYSSNTNTLIMGQLFYVLTLEDGKYHSPKSKCISFNFSLGKSLGNSKMKKSLHSSDSLQADWELVCREAAFKDCLLSKAQGPWEEYTQTREGAFWSALVPLGAASVWRGLPRSNCVSAHTAPGKGGWELPGLGEPCGKARFTCPELETPGACSGTDSGVLGTTPKDCLECYLILWWG